MCIIIYYYVKSLYIHWIGTNGIETDIWEFLDYIWDIPITYKNFFYLCDILKSFNQVEQF